MAVCPTFSGDWRPFVVQDRREEEKQTAISTDHDCSCAYGRASRHPLGSGRLGDRGRYGTPVVDDVGGHAVGIPSARCTHAPFVIVTEPPTTVSFHETNSDRVVRRRRDTANVVWCHGTAHRWAVRHTGAVWTLPCNTVTDRGVAGQSGTRYLIVKGRAPRADERRAASFMCAASHEVASHDRQPRR